MVDWSNLVSAQGPLVLGLGLKRLGLRVWGQGLTIFGIIGVLAKVGGGLFPTGRVNLQRVEDPKQLHIDP